LREFARKQDVTALVRPASLNNPKELALQKRGVKLLPVDLDGPIDDIAAQLKGIEVVLSCLLMKETILADAAKKAGVGRFVPCWYATVMPRSILSLRDEVCLSFPPFLKA
jgi:hypothetical protein